MYMPCTLLDRFFFVRMASSRSLQLLLARRGEHLLADGHHVLGVSSPWLRLVDDFSICNLFSVRNELHRTISCHRQEHSWGFVLAKIPPCTAVHCTASSVKLPNKRYVTINSVSVERASPPTYNIVLTAQVPFEKSARVVMAIIVAVTIFLYLFLSFFISLSLSLGPLSRLRTQH